ncbi:helix-turn-helix transcriptional regulator [Aminobacter sp. SR38]|uniref:helix-turn-helix domain-containing protein n=1 Tax=Aminobacter sp. SR38 TaxID=2774562 RepID=UPI001780A62F|nr:XRE family transcriptional regulator [Aminobacter sp. SR38]QOF70827.1 helix-turn-helix transcriptional regulator [Aminobacter sp. SR38]
MESDVCVDNYARNNVGLNSRQLQVLIGREVRKYRRKHEITATELAHAAGISLGMLSKIEKGIISPSLGTLHSLSEALAVPISALLRRAQAERTAVFTKCVSSNAGEKSSIIIEAISSVDGFAVHPLILTFTSENLNKSSEICSEAGIKFIFILDGKMEYNHGDKTYDMATGDSLQFDAIISHGPKRLNSSIVKCLSILSVDRNN